ncbi:glycoprotein-N-acetylgalactosamine 3-beta-galactosyltransferase 1 [Scaptodrosophila lebanonensis]|uniref:N-acetylgalactosaminide beta-1,3-galactosyltransferase n=1 Tax=Drosophila lebanonensis TaxID=7225 RepID=A0A6J2UHS0_DROLE|nr:glycoprotein-N-acetylgalactosamine 3-beta-galactosyltransferase 1 [Scaptodrosophila lebanonensis]
MIEQRITLEQVENNVIVPPAAFKREDLQVFLGGERPRVYRLSQRQLLLLLLLLFGSGLIVCYVYWEVTMLSGLASLPHRGGGSNESLAQTMEREVRVLCWVLTTPEYHKSRAVHILRTWGRRCNKIYFMTSQPDDELETIVLTKPDKYEVLWGKTKEAFTYLYEHKRHEADWFMKADDDTFVFVENLRYMLYPYSPDIPIYFGFNYKLFPKPKEKAVYMSGGSGYVLSREALRLFVEGLNDTSKCREQDDQAEDIEAGICLRNVGVLAGDSRDARLRNRFSPMTPFSTLMSHYYGMDFWYFKYAFYNSRACMDCLSNYPVAFHYVRPELLYLYDYLNYEFQRYGRPQHEDYLPAKIEPDKLVIPESDNDV